MSHENCRRSPDLSLSHEDCQVARKSAHLVVRGTSEKTLTTGPLKRQLKVNYPGSDGQVWDLGKVPMLYICGLVTAAASPVRRVSGDPLWPFWLVITFTVCTPQDMSVLGAMDQDSSGLTRGAGGDPQDRPLVQLDQDSCTYLLRLTRNIPAGRVNNSVLPKKKRSWESGVVESSKTEFESFLLYHGELDSDHQDG